MVVGTNSRRHCYVCCICIYVYMHMWKKMYAAHHTTHTHRNHHEPLKQSSETYRCIDVLMYIVMTSHERHTLPNSVLLLLHTRTKEEGKSEVAYIIITSIIMLWTHNNIVLNVYFSVCVFNFVFRVLS